MDNMKSWYQSKTVWGALIAVLAPLLHVVGLNCRPVLKRSLRKGWSPLPVAWADWLRSMDASAQTASSGNAGRTHGGTRFACCHV